MKRIINRALRKWLPPRLKQALILGSTRNLMECTLRNMRANGFNPPAIIDVGAFEGTWTALVRPIFPQARILMAEAQPDKEPILKAMADRDSKITYKIGLLGAQPKESVTFFKMKTGSSIFSENSGAARDEVSLPMYTLNQVVNDAGFASERNMLLKLDVQGAEIEILRGADEILPNVTAVLAEVSVVEYNFGAPQFAQIIAFMHERGFVVYDVADIRRFKKTTLGQLDIIFVREDSPLRLHWRKQDQRKG